MTLSADDPLYPFLERVRIFYDTVWRGPNWAGRCYRRRLGHYYRHAVPPDASVLEVGCGAGDLLAELPNADLTGLDLSSTQLEKARQRLPQATFIEGAAETFEPTRQYDVIIVSDTLNQAADVQRLLANLRRAAHRGTRLLINTHSNLWRPFFALGEALGIRRPQINSNWLSVSDLSNLLDLAEWRPMKREARILCPVPLLGLDYLANRFLAPFLPLFCLSVFRVARLKAEPVATLPSVSVIVPARNEAGNIAAAVSRTPRMGRSTEIIFVEGHSSDDTWATIERVVAEHPEANLKAIRQSGRGKGNAVREGFAAATGDIVMILDADLTMPPEELPKFYEVLASGKAEFANGVRLVYPMEKHAMRFLNMCANHGFSVAFSWLLGQPVKDTLCGTKVLWRRDYERVAANRAHFGEFDPFGDFDLLFGANRLQLKIADIPIRYRDRTYGSTNIHRWRHGLLLLRMVLFAAWRIKFI